MRRENGTFLPGGSPGRPRGARNRLQSSFVRALAEDFEQHGADAIRICRIEEPARYVHIIASLMPKELEVAHNALSELSDEDVDEMIMKLRAELATTEKPMPLIEAKLVEKVEA